MRFRKVLFLLPVLLLALLPALSAVQRWGVEWLLQQTQLEARWGHQSGYLLRQLEFTDLSLKGAGLQLQAERLRVSFDLLALLRGELPLEVSVEDGRLDLRWSDIFAPAAPAQRGPAVRLDRLSVRRLEVILDEDQRLVLPQAQFLLEGQAAPYRIEARLPGGNFTAEARPLDANFQDWELQTRGDLAGLSYWFEGFLGGELAGQVRLVDGQLTIDQQLSQGLIEVVGFRLENVAGPVAFANDKLDTQLRGQALGGPATGWARVDLTAQQYRFELNGQPTLPALASTYNLDLPVTGQGPLRLVGYGWDKITIDGEFSGRGEILGEAATYRGSLAFKDRFELQARFDSRYYDRGYQAQINWVDQQYTVGLSDTLGSRINLRGQGNQTRASGQLILPQPLKGQAQIDFASQASRWQARVATPPVGLLGTRPFVLDGNLKGEGQRVEGQLGPLGLRGNWNDLALSLAPLELVQGQTLGTGRLREGRISADLQYQSPYTRFPVQVRQAGNEIYLQNPFGQGRWADGIFNLQQADLPLKLGAQNFQLSGNLRYAGRLDGRWELTNRWLKAQGVLDDLATSVTARAQLGTQAFDLEGHLKFANRLEGNWVVNNPYLTGGGRWSDLGTSFAGQARLGQERFDLKGNLDFRSGITGQVAIDNPYVQASGPIEGLRANLAGQVKLGTEQLALKGWVGYASQLEGAWQLDHRWGRATGQIAGFATDVKAQLQLGQEQFDLEGKVGFANGFSGDWQLRNRLIEASGQLDNLSTQFTGQALVGGQKLNLAGQVGYERGQLEGQYQIDHPVGRLVGRLAGLQTTLSGQLTALGQQVDLQASLDLALLQGRWQASGSSLELAGSVDGPATRFAGQAFTPLGELPLVGQVDASGLLLQADRMQARWSSDGLTVGGPLQLGDLQLDADLVYRQQLDGNVVVDSPWISGVITARNGVFAAQTSGWAELSGQVWPQPNLRGRLTIPPVSGLSLPPLDIEATPELVRVGRSWVRLDESYSFAVNLPLVYQGVALTVQAGGDRRQGEVQLALPWGTMEGRGLWENLGLTGRLAWGPMEATLVGQADLLQQKYSLAGQIPWAQASLRLEGQGLRARLSGQAQEGALTLQAGLDQSLELMVLANQLDLQAWGIPAQVSGRWGMRGGQLTIESPYGQLEGVAPDLLGPLAFKGQTIVGAVRGLATSQELNLMADLQIPYLSGRLFVQGPFSQLKVRGQGRYQVPVLEGATWKLDGSLASQGWQLDGPVRLKGQGLRYEGSVLWPYQLLGRKGVLTGQLGGEALKPWLQANTLWDGLPLYIDAELSQPSLAGLTARASWPQGQARLFQQQVDFSAELAPLARLYGLPLGGLLEGQLNLEGSGEATGTLTAWGQPVELAYRNQQAQLYLPQLDQRVNLDARQIQFQGPLQGQLGFHQGLQGQLNLRQPDWQASAQIAGSLAQPQLTLQATWPGWLEASLESVWQLEGLQSRGKLQLGSPYGALQADLETEGSRYTLRGRLQTEQYLRQSGPFELSGEGLNWAAAWQAPLGVRLSGTALKLEQVALAGTNRLDIPGYPLNLQGSLGYRLGQASGAMEVTGNGIQLRLLGQPDGVVLQGQAYGARVDMKSNFAAQLAGSARYELGLGPSQLLASAQVSGSLWDPLVKLSGGLQGAGQRIELEGQLDRLGWWARATGPGVEARMEADQLNLSVDTDLEPYLGYAVRLVSSTSGAWNDLELPLALELPHGAGQATGTVQLFPPSLSLQGRAWDQRFALTYQQLWQLDLSGPYLSGRASFDGNNLSGQLGVEVPLPEGSLAGQLDLAARRLLLEAKGEWKGRLQATLPAVPLNQLPAATAALEARLSGPVSLPIELDSRIGLRLNGQVARAEGKLQLGSYGWAQLTANQGQLVMQGRDGLAPLQLGASLVPLGLNWSYQGALPANLGRLEAQGSYPGVWLKGVYDLWGQQIGLQGQGSEVVVSGPALQGTLGLAGPRLAARLEAQGVELEGNIAGSWQNLQANLGWQALGWQGKANLGWQQGRLTGRLDGDIEGTFDRSTSWRGNLQLPQGSFALAGSDWIPQLSGSLWGLPLRLDYPLLVSGNLNLDLVSRRATGLTNWQGLQLKGNGPWLALGYSTPLGQLQGEFDLNTLALQLGADFARGKLTYAGGQLGGEISLEAYTVALRLQGKGDRLTLAGSHPASPYLPWGEGRLEGQLTPNGQWSLQYRDPEGRQTLAANGRWLDSQIKLVGTYLQGELAYANGWKGRANLEVPLPFSDSLLRGVVEGGGGLFLRSNIKGEIGSVGLEASLTSQGTTLQAVLQEVEVQTLPWWRGRLDYLRGRVSGTLDYRANTWQGRLTSPGLGVDGDPPLPLDLALAYRDQDLGGVFRLGDSQAVFGLANGNLAVQARVSSFPLHWLLSAWAGPLEGEAYWTGRASFRYNLANPWASQGLAVGEGLRFKGAGDELKGKAVLRLERERLYVDQLKLSGQGSWNASGYLGRGGSDFRLDLIDTVFTPVLQVIPGLRPYFPEGGGTLRLSLRQEDLSVLFERFRFRLGPVAGQIPEGRVEVGEQASSSGRLILSAPYPAEADLAASGTNEAFTVKARGTATVPLVEGSQPLDIQFGYPGYTLQATAGDAQLAGEVYPLRLTLNGELPISYPRYYLQEGRVRVENGLIVQRGGVYRVSGNVEVLKAKLALPQGQRQVEVAIPLEKPPSPVPLEFDNVTIRAERGILFQENFAQGEVFGEVTLGGTLSDPFLAGEVRSLRGEVALNDTISFTLRDAVTLTEGNEERVMQSRIRFSPIEGILPELELVGEASVRDGRPGGYTYAVFLQAKGRFVRRDGLARFVFDETYPRFMARSANPTAPVLSTPEVVALVSLGRSDLQALPTSLTQTALQTALQNLVLGQINREVSQALGVDLFRLDTGSVFRGNDFTQSLQDTRIEFGKYLSERLLITGGLDFRGEGYFAAEYQLDGLRLRLDTDLPLGTLLSTQTFNPRPNFSMALALSSSLDLSFELGYPRTQEGLRVGAGVSVRF
jgi:hypothetical protein